jgi:hypothetical protein
MQNPSCTHFVTLIVWLVTLRVFSAEASCILNTATICRGHQFLNSSYPYFDLVMASVNGSNITIQIRTNCIIEDDNVTHSSETSPNNIVKKRQFSDTVNAILPFKQSSCFPCSQYQRRRSDSFVTITNSDSCGVNIFFLNYTEFNSYQSQRLNTSELSSSDSYFNVSFLNVSKVIRREIDRIVIENGNNYPIEVVYVFQYFPVVASRNSCLAAIGSAIGLCVLISLALCWCCVADGEIFKDPDGLNIPAYPYHKPLVIPCCMCCKVPCWQQQIHGFWYYWLQMDQIFWVRWPERTETLNLFQRIVITITFLCFHLIVQIFWNRIFVSNKFIYDLAGNLPTFLAFLFVRLVSASTFVMIIGTFYRPFIRCVSAPTPIWGTDPNSMKRIIGHLLKYSGAVVLVIAVLFTLWGLYVVLVRYDCNYLWFQVLMPFFGTLLLQTALLATPMRFITYIAKNTWGHPVILTEQETAKILFKDDKTKRWSRESNSNDDFSP